MKHLRCMSVFVYFALAKIDAFLLGKDAHSISYPNSSHFSRNQYRFPCSWRVKIIVQFRMRKVCYYISKGCVFDWFVVRFGVGSKGCISENTFVGTFLVFEDVMREIGEVKTVVEVQLGIQQGQGIKIFK